MGGMLGPAQRYPAILLSISLAIAGCGSQSAEEAPQTDTSQPVAVRVARVEGRDEPVAFEATGSFQAAEVSDVAPEASGRVVATPVDVGDSVTAGQTLVRIQAVDAGLRLEEARAAVSRAEANVSLAQSESELAELMRDRQQKLFGSGHVSRAIADEARTQAETATQRVVTARASLAETRAQLALAEKALNDVAVTAPFAGFISARNVSLGEYVQPSVPVVQLVKIDPLRLQLSIPAVQANQVARGQRVHATVDSYPGRIFEGAITAVNPVIAPESRSFLVEVSVPNPKALLKPGMFAVASIDQGTAMRVLIVPREAVVADVNTDSWRAFVVDEENRARLRVVQLAARQQGDVVRVASGLNEGERVAISNLGDLFDSAEVTIAGAADRDGEGGGIGAPRSAE